MYSVPRSCGPAIPMCAACKDGLAMAAAHCSRTAGLHNWPCTREARGPTYTVSQVCRRWRAGRHSWDRTGHSHRWWAVSGAAAAQQELHVAVGGLLR